MQLWSPEATARLFPKGYFPSTFFQQNLKVVQGWDFQQFPWVITPQSHISRHLDDFPAVQPTFSRFLISCHYLWLWPQLIKVLQCMLKFRYVLKLHWNHVHRCFAGLMDMRMCLSTVLNWDHASSKIILLLLHIFKPLSFPCLIID